MFTKTSNLTDQYHLAKATDLFKLETTCRVIQSVGKLQGCILSVGNQTLNFPRNGHRTAVIGKKLDCKNDKDQMVLSRHFSVFHGIAYKPPIHEAYFAVTQRESLKLSGFHTLDKCEDQWHHQLDAQINIRNMFLPRVNNF